MCLFFVSVPILPCMLFFFFVGLPHYPRLPRFAPKCHRGTAALDEATTRRPTHFFLCASRCFHPTVRCRVYLWLYRTGPASSHQKSPPKRWDDALSIPPFLPPSTQCCKRERGKRNNTRAGEDHQQQQPKQKHTKNGR